MAENPTLYCSRCRTTKPPLVARRSYTCVMCGKTRNGEDFRAELEELRLSAPRPAPSPPPSLKPTPAPSPKPTPAPSLKPTPAPSLKPTPPPSLKPTPPPEPEPAPEPAPTPSPVADPAAPAVTCAWHECSNPPRSSSKYCSRNCSNKNARWRHSKRPE